MAPFLTWRRPRPFVLVLLSTPVALVLAAGASTAAASSIAVVEVLPALPGPDDPVVLSTELAYPTTGFAFDSAAVGFPEAMRVELELYVDAPLPGDITQPVLGSETVDVGLGLLAPGDYAYTVRLYDLPGGLEPVLQETASGSFTVVPEPGSVTLLGATLLALGLRRRAAASQGKLRRSRSSASLARGLRSLRVGAPGDPSPPWGARWRVIHAGSSCDRTIFRRSPRKPARAPGSRLRGGAPRLQRHDRSAPRADRVLQRRGRRDRGRPLRAGA